MRQLEQKEEIRYGVILSYVQMALSIIIGVVYTPVMIHKLGQSEYGLYTTSASVISMLSILSLGFGSGYLKFFARYKANNDRLSISKLNGLFLIIFSVVGLVALIIGLFLTFNLRIIYDDGLTSQEYEIARVLMFLLTVNLSISFPMSVFGTIVSANEKFVFQKVVNMGKTILTPLLTVPLLLCGMRSIAVVTVTVVMAILVDTICVIYVLKDLNQKFIFHDFDKSLFKSLFTYTLFILINTLVRQVNWNIDKVILGRMQGTIAVAIYGVASTLHTYYENFSTSVSGVFRTRVHMIVNTTELDGPEQREKLTNLFIRVGRIQFLILGLIASGLCLFGFDFIVKFWAGSGYEDSYLVCLLLVIPASIPLIQNVGIDVQRALNRHQFRSVVYLMMCVLNLFLTIMLSKKYGAIGAAAGTAISVLIVDGLIMNLYYHIRCNINVIRFWIVIIRCSLGILPAIVFGVLLNKFIVGSSLIVFILKIFIYTIVYFLSIWLLSLNKAEKSSMLKKLKFGRSNI